MIKTKTPRHWGGGIRQVSLPMLTSRLSNIGRWRTNGWKDYSRAINATRCFFGSNVYNTSQLWDRQNSKVILSVYTPSCSISNDKFEQPIDIYRLQQYIDKFISCRYTCIHLFRQHNRCDRTGRKHNTRIYINSFRLTLKGVA